MKTRAAICVGPNVPLEIDLIDVRGPAEGEVLIEIKASGLCHTDMHMIDGSMPLAPYPVVLGHEGAGIVVEVGPGVRSVKPGDHVIPAPIPECRECANCTSGRTNMCLEFTANAAAPDTPFSRHGQPIHQFYGASTFANFTVVRESVVAKIRDDAPLDTVCYAGCGVATGIGAVLKTAQVWPGASVVVFGIGGIGYNVLQAARLAGARQIVAVDINPARETMAKSFGATHFVNPREFDDDPVAQLLALTGGGADFTFECVGSAQLTSQAILSSRPGWGVNIAIGGVPIADDIRLQSMTIMTGRTWKGSMLGGMRPRSDLPGLIDMVMEGRIDIASLITHRLPFEEINQGFDLMARGESIRTVITF